MVKKLEYASPTYWCDLRQELDGGEPTECNMSPWPDCRRCPARPELEKKVAYKRYRAREGIPI